MTEDQAAQSRATLNAAVLTSLLHIKIDEDLGNDLQILPDVYLTNNRRTIRDLITPHFQRIVGVLETKTILNSYGLLFAFRDLPAAELPRSTFIETLNEFLSQARFVLISLWLIKDNSVDFELGFLEVPHKADGARISSNFLAMACRAADGSIAPTLFSRSELEQAAYILREYIVGYVLTGLNAERPYRLRRIQRAIYLLQGARHQKDLGLRVAWYCMCFEALFSTAPIELAHKLAERVAYFVGRDPDHRAQVFSDMKAAYTVRSIALHGDVLPDRIHQRLKDHALFCDGTLRQVLNLVLSSPELREVFDSTTDQLEDYFADLTLGRRPPPTAT